jgi:hypothetical protein
MKILLLVTLLSVILGNVSTATDHDSVTEFKQQNAANCCTAILFYTPKSKGLFSLFGLFTSEETDSAMELRIAESC